MKSLKPHLDMAHAQEILMKTQQFSSPDMSKTPSIHTGAKEYGMSPRRENFSSIMKEKAKMAATFRSTARTDKFLPNVIQTAHNQTQPAFTANLVFDMKAYNQTPKPQAAVSVIDRMIPEEPEDKEFSQYFKEKSELVSQMPINSSKIDFNILTPQRIKARNTKPRPRL